jgi:hypothetical protein
VSYRRSSPGQVVRPGKVVVLAALFIIPIMGAVAVSVEGGLMLDHRRQLQAATDAAALAAAESLFSNYQSYKGADTNGSAATAAKASAAANGYNNDGTNSTVTVNVPPLSGDHVGQLGYAEVLIQYNQPRYFSRVFGSTSMPIKARAVARGMWAASRMGILVLDPSVSESLKANGGGTVQVANADLIVNSNDPGSVGSDGTGSIIKVTNATADLTGGLKSNTSIQGGIAWNQPPTPDPLAYLTPPPLPSTVLTATKYSANNATAKPYLQALGLQAKDVNQVYILEPGRYDRMPNFGNGDVVILQEASYNNQKGVYYLNNSGFTSTGATIAMDPTGATTGGLMFYNDPQSTSNGINITGGQITLSPPTAPPYKGIMFWENRNSTVPLSITGQGGMQISGTFYVAGGPIQITGSSATNMDVIGSQYISRTLQSGGNGQYMVNWDPNNVAPLRQLAIVE